MRIENLWYYWCTSHTRGSNFSLKRWVDILNLKTVMKSSPVHKVSWGFLDTWQVEAQTKLRRRCNMKTLRCSAEFHHYKYFLEIWLNTRSQWRKFWSVMRSCFIRDQLEGPDGVYRKTRAQSWSSQVLRSRGTERATEWPPWRANGLIRSFTA